MREYLKRTWAEIDLDALENNYNAIRNHVDKDCEICWIVKADGYGHGAVDCSRTLQSLGAKWFAVSNIEEALQLRAGGIEGSILILGYTPPSEAKILSEMNISQAVFSYSYANDLSKKAKESGVTVKIHLKVDTGMSRIGFMYQKNKHGEYSINEIEEVLELDNLEHEGIFTHFAVSDDGDAGAGYTREQYEMFMECISKLEQKGIKFRYRHCANSGAVCDYPEMHLDMVRPGIIVYGLDPSSAVNNHLDLKPVMELKTVISMIKEIPTDTTVSYGRDFIANRNTVLATVPIGYADGYPRKLHSNGCMLVNGHRAKIAGRVCMDQLMLDVTGIPDIEEGMTVVVFGQDGDEFLSINELAAKNGTINYEMLCIIGKRVPRIFIKNGEPVGELNYILP